MLLVVLAQAWRAGGGAETQTSLAVLPFADLSAERDKEYFAEGVAEEILNIMGSGPGLPGGGADLVVAV